ncbi:hypothetical protein [Metabacillus sp. RGM 3146]|uniref:hypothetical protein n=1 Tax=Metabacillus sp. RGM 3146 TaxID=3401092 RepID=UPI003B99734E
MGRGKHFNHKKESHVPTPKEYGGEVSPKQTQKAGYDIEPVASEGDLPVSIKQEDQLD